MNDITRRDIALIKHRLNSQSRRIKKFRTKLDQIISNQKHYIQKRLPQVIARARAHASFTNELERARKILSAFGRDQFSVVSRSKDKKKREQRYVGLFTHVELQRLRRLLETDHSYTYRFYRTAAEELKDKNIIVVDKTEAQRLRYLLKKKKKRD